MAKQIQISRQALFNKIWSTPLKRVAMEYHLSDVGLAKICARHQIPRPPVGYWTCLKHGYHPKQTPLSSVADIRLEMVEITVRDLPDSSADPSFQAMAKEQRAKAGGRSLEIVVPESLDSPHPLVQSAIAAFRGAKTGENGILIPRVPETINTRVTAPLLSRSLRIWNALIPALEAQGFEIAVKKDVPHATIVSVLGEVIPVCLLEEIDTSTREATPQEQAKLRRQRRFETKITEYTPTGRLGLRIFVTEGLGIRQRWSDSARGTLEKKLSEFLEGLVDAAARINAERNRQLEWKRQSEEASRQRELRRKQYKEEKEHLEKLVKEVDAWQLSQRLRSYAEALRAKAVQADNLIDPQSAIVKEIEWILGQADRLDPFVESPPSILDDPQPLWW